MKPEIPKSLTILITLAVREKRMNGLKCHFLNSANGVKTACDIRLQNEPI